MASLEVTPEQTTIYLNDHFEPVEPDEATWVKVVKADGHVIFGRKKEG